MSKPIGPEDLSITLKLSEVDQIQAILGKAPAEIVRGVMNLLDAKKNQVMQAANAFAGNAATPPAAPPHPEIQRSAQRAARGGNGKGAAN